MFALEISPKGFPLGALEISKSRGILFLQDWRTVLEIPEIIERYNYVIRGYLNFYSPIILYPAELGYLHYFLSYSCYHTIANKLNTNIGKVIGRFGKDLNVTSEIKNSFKKNFITTKDDELNSRKTKTISLISWKDSQSIMKKNIESMISNRQKKIPLTPDYLISKSIYLLLQM